MTSFTTLVCPVIVGRTHELDALERHLDGGGPPELVVSGEAGIGKSRLITEAGRRARDRGLRVLQGACYESDRVLPYAPLLDLLRALFATVSLDERAPSVGAAAAELAVLLPGLSRRAPAPVIPAIAEPAQHRSRVFYALCDLVAALAATSPLLVVVEDLHWSDEASLDFLAHLARHIVPYGHCSTTPASGGGGAAAEPHAADAPVRLVLSYRSDEPHPTLPHVLAGLERERLAIELGLVRLTRDQLDAMVRAIFTLHDPIPADVVHMLHRLADGNPFFGEEVLTSLVELGDLSYAGGIWMRKPLDAWRIPRTIHDAVQRRTTGLSGAARQVLTIAASAQAV